MERFNALGRGAQIMLAAGVLFLISTFFNWQSVDIGVADVGQSAWNGFWGVVMGLLAIVLVAWLAARVAGLDLPIPVSAALIGIVLAVVIFLFALIKALTDDFVSGWAWVGVVLAALIVVGAALEVQAAGGVDALRAETSSFGGSGAGGSSTAAASSAAPEAAGAAAAPGPASDPPAAPVAEATPAATEAEAAAEDDAPPENRI